MGRLVALEGIDGSGKSTLAQSLVQALRQRGTDVVSTSEPTTMDTGALLRNRLKLTAGNTPLNAAVDAEYFVADRIQHNAMIIDPAIRRGATVICDRYDLGTLAYQSVHGLALDYLIEKRELVIRHRLARPAELYLLVDVSPEEAVSRIRQRGRSLDKFEDGETLSRLRKIYLRLAQEISNIVVLDGSQSPEQLHQAALRTLDQKISSLKPRGEGSAQ